MRPRNLAIFSLSKTIDAIQMEHMSETRILPRKCVSDRATQLDVPQRCKPALLRCLIESCPSWVSSWRDSMSISQSLPASRELLCWIQVNSYRLDFIFIQFKYFICAPLQTHAVYSAEKTSNLCAQRYMRVSTNIVDSESRAKMADLHKCCCDCRHFDRWVSSVWKVSTRMACSMRVHWMTLSEISWLKEFKREFCSKKKAFDIFYV